MKNKRGFTIVEIISVIAVLSLLMIICVPIIGNTSINIKKKTLNTKIENIEKAAVLYGQDNKDKFVRETDGYCNGISNCYYYNGTIKVSELINGKYIEPDNEIGITNPLDESKFLNDCEIQIYEKYGKVYAVHLDATENDRECWYLE